MTFKRLSRFAQVSFARDRRGVSKPRSANGASSFIFAEDEGIETCPEYDRPPGRWQTRKECLCGLTPSEHRQLKLKLAKTWHFRLIFGRE